MSQAKFTPSDFDHVRAALASNRKPKNMAAAFAMYKQEEEFCLANGVAKYSPSHVEAMLESANIEEYGMSDEHAYYLAEAKAIRERR
jgi:hypothetical protein